jgi:hypothetical protein
MLRLTAGQRNVLIDRLPALANFGVGSRLFGQMTFYLAAAEDA